MSDNIDQDAFRTLLIELLAYKTAHELGELQLLPDDRLDAFKRVATPRADEIIRAYEKRILIREVRQIILSEVKQELLQRSRVAKIIEIAINVSALVTGGLIGLSQFIFDPVQNQKQITAVYCILLAVVGVQFLGNLYLKYIDERK